MDKLTIGIFLEPNVDGKSGGASAYYETLIEAIDGYQFDRELEFKLIHSEPEDPPGVTNKVLRIDPYNNIGRKTRYKQLLNYNIIRPIRKTIAPLHSFYQTMESNFDVAYNRSIEAELVKNKIDLLYYIYPRANKLKYPFVCTHWDIGHRSMFSFPEVAMNDNITRRQHYYQTTVQEAFAVYCESVAGKNELIRYTGINEDRIFVMPLFPGKVIDADVPAVQQAAHLCKHGLTEQGYFFYPAQFWSHKNHYNLLQAFKHLQQTHPALKMLFTGSDKGNQDYIKKVVADLNLHHSIIMPGFVSNEEVHSFYNGAIALVMPTFLGPTNMPLLEAEALGCPVICSDLEGHREMLSENASYVQPGDPESICRAMWQHVNSPVKKERCTNAVFNLKNAIKEMEANFLRLKPRRKAFGFNYNQI